MNISNPTRTIRSRRTDKVGALLFGLVAAFVLHPEAVRAQQPADPATVAEGAAVYGDMCGRCHNPRSPLERSDRDWVTIINHMRIRGNLTGGQVRRVLAFLQATNDRPVRVAISPAEAGARVALDAPIRPELADRGREIIAQKPCLGCHVIAGKGAQVGPSLDGVIKRRSPGFIRQKLADPTFNNETSMMPNFGLTSDEIEAVLAYLASLDGK